MLPLLLLLLSLALAPAHARGVSSMKYSGLSAQQVITFLQEGHIMLRDLVPELKREAFLQELEDAKVEAQKAYHVYALKKTGCPDMLPEVDAGNGKAALKRCVAQVTESTPEGEELPDAPFYQLIDLHQFSDAIHKVATSIKLGATASDLLQVDLVRLYQTGTFRKVPSKDQHLTSVYNQPTGMHTDLNQIPVDTNAYLTFWCPTRNLTLDDSVLTYASGSHRDESYNSWFNNAEDDDEEEEEEEAPMNESEADRILRESKSVNSPEIKKRYNVVAYDNINVGDCIAHHGWLQHGCTSQALKGGAREAVTFSYIDGNAKKLPPADVRKGRPFFEDDGSSEDEMSFNQWFYDIPENGVIDHPKLIVVWPHAFDEDVTNLTACEKVERGVASVFEKIRCNLEKEEAEKEETETIKKDL